MNNKQIITWLWIYDINKWLSLYIVDVSFLPPGRVTFLCNSMRMGCCSFQLPRSCYPDGTIPFSFAAVKANKVVN